MGGEDTIGELPYPQEYDYLWTDERNALDLQVEEDGIWNPSVWFQGASDRQGVAGYSPLVIGFISGFLYTVFMLVGFWVNPGARSLNETPRLENDEKCGITTGGQVGYFSERSNHLILGLSGGMLVGLYDHIRRTGGRPSYY